MEPGESASSVPGRDLVTTQWGSQARPFRAFSQEELRRLLERASRLAHDITASTGVPVFLTYGCLLGAARTGSVVPHDFDIDLGFLAPGDGSPEEVLAAIRKVVDFLSAQGFRIVTESNGQFKAWQCARDGALAVEFFACWVDARTSGLYHYFAVRHAKISAALFPLATIELCGVPFPAPRQPEVLLEAIYGPGWRVPDPGFRYQLTAKDWEPFKFLFVRERQPFWDSYYANRDSNRVWLESPTHFAAFIGSECKAADRLLDIGCGNGRDSVFFSTLGLKVAAADFSAEALKACAATASRLSVSIKTEHLNLSSLADVSVFAARNRDQFDILYGRFLLHAIDEACERNLLRMARECLVVGGRLALEYRCLPPEPAMGSLHFENGDHYRRLIVQESLHAEAERLGFVVQYSARGHGLAKFRAEDPLVGRSILVKA